MDRGNPRVRLDRQILEEYRTIAAKLGVRPGELITELARLALSDRLILLEAYRRFLARKRAPDAKLRLYTAIKVLLGVEFGGPQLGGRATRPRAPGSS